MKINELMKMEEGYLNRKNEQMSLFELLQLEKISKITSLYFDRLAEYSKTHTIEELEEYKSKLDDEDINF